MENDKYFTPEIKDVYVGYELEWKCKIRNQDWEKTICDTDLISIIYDEYEHADFEEPYNEQFRVPYLTNQQLENEGWTYYQNIPDMVVPEGYIEYYKDVEWFKIVISISETNHYLTVEKVFQNVQIGNELQEFRNTIYNGECKDINTFRKIIKLLGI